MARPHQPARRMRAWPPLRGSRVRWRVLMLGTSFTAPPSPVRQWMRWRLTRPWGLVGLARVRMRVLLRVLCTLVALLGRGRHLAAGLRALACLRLALRPLVLRAQVLVLRLGLLRL